MCDHAACHSAFKALRFYHIAVAGSAQSAVPLQNANTSTAQPDHDCSKGPAPSLRALPEQPHAQRSLAEKHHSIPAQASTVQPQPQALPHQNQQSGPRAGRQQPQALQGDHPLVRSSPLYAASEAEDSESESSAGRHTEHPQAQAAQDPRVKQGRVLRGARDHPSSTSNPATDAQQPVVKQDQVMLPQPARQTGASSGQASRAVKPPSGRAQGRAKPKAPANPVGRQKGKKHAGLGDADDLDGFGLLSEDDQQPTRQSKKASAKPDGVAQVQQQKGLTRPPQAGFWVNCCFMSQGSNPGLHSQQSACAVVLCTHLSCSCLP